MSGRISWKRDMVVVEAKVAHDGVNKNLQKFNIEGKEGV